jgi:hypothetical protein
VNAAAEALEALYAALQGVEGLRVVRGVGLQADPPAVVVPPPNLTWNAMGDEPTDATFTVALLVSFNDRITEELLKWQPLVVAALQTVDNTVVTTAVLGSWPAGGGTDLPAYLITTEVGL